MMAKVNDQQIVSDNSPYKYGMRSDSPTYVKVSWAIVEKFMALAYCLSLTNEEWWVQHDKKNWIHVDASNNVRDVIN